MLGLESQEHIHYAMPIRVMGYDYSTYKKQYDSNAKKYKTADGMKPDEYLSRMKKIIMLLKRRAAECVHYLKRLRKRAR